MVERLTEVLLALGFAAGDIRLENAGGGKVAGVIVSERFRDHSQEDRQNQLWDELRMRMPPEELIQIVALMTMTPEEIAA